MNVIHAKKGYGLRLQGRPDGHRVNAPKPATVGVLPARIPFIKPRLKVKENDTVAVGSVLFEDKRRPELQFLSPGGGVVERITFGPRRVIEEILIRLDSQEQYREFERYAERALEQTPREELVSALLAGGLWPLLRALPFRDIADPERPPPAIYVSLDDQEPWYPRASVYLQNQTERLLYGLRVLSRLAPVVRVFARNDSLAVLKKLNGYQVTEVRGAYPADDAGVLLYHTRTSAADNTAWYIQGQDLLLLAELLQTGRYPTTRTLTLAGRVTNPCHVRVRWGAPFAAMLRASHNNGIMPDVRWIAGGVFRGSSSTATACSGFYDTALHILPEGRQREFLGFVRPGSAKPSFSRTFLSVFNHAPLAASTNLGGGVRACVACGNCVRICPVDILPQLAYKAILAEDVEGFLALGLLDCVECGLCTYACPSKIELDSTFKAAKATYYREQIKP